MPENREPESSPQHSPRFLSKDPLPDVSLDETHQRADCSEDQHPGGDRWQERRYRRWDHAKNHPMKAPNGTLQERLWWRVAEVVGNPCCLGGAPQTSNTPARWVPHENHPPCNGLGTKRVWRTAQRILVMSHPGITWTV